MVIPNDLDLADVAERACLHQIVRSDLIWLAAMLSPNLHNAIALHNRVPRCLHLSV